MPHPRRPPPPPQRPSARSRPASPPPARAQTVRQPPRPSHAPQARPGGHPATRPATRPPVIAHPAYRQPAGAPAPAHYSGTPKQLLLWADQAIRAAQYARIPIEIEWGVFGRETNFGRYIGTSSTGAMGLMQFEPATARDYHYPMTNYPDVTQSQTQFTAGALYLRDLNRQHNGNWDAALLAYSGGGYDLAGVQQTANSRALPGAPSPGTMPGTPLYVNPLGAARVTPERVDQGVDYSIQGGALVAISDGVVTTASANFPGWPGGMVIYRITQPGPLDGMFVYYAEGVTPTVTRNQVIRSADKLADLRPGWHTGLEIGVADDGASGVTWARRHGGFDGVHSTWCGVQFSALIAYLGGPHGIAMPGAAIGEKNPQLTAFLNDPSLPQQDHGIPLDLGTPSYTGQYADIANAMDAAPLISKAWLDLGRASVAARNQAGATQHFVTSVRYVTNKGWH